MDSDLVLILGGSSGIGFAVAKAVLALGAKVIIASSSQTKVDDAVTRLGQNAVGRTCNLSDAPTLERNVTDLLESSVGVTHIVHSAGELYLPNTLSDFDPTTTFDHWTVRYSTALMLAKVGSKIKSLKSITFTSGSTTSTGKATVVGMIGAIAALTEGLALELAPIRVNCVAPGAISTELTAKIMSSEQGKIAVEKLIQEKQVLHKFGRPEDAAQAYVYFMRDGFQTGTVLKTDGGLHLV